MRAHRTQHHPDKEGHHSRDHRRSLLLPFAVIALSYKAPGRRQARAVKTSERQLETAVHGHRENLLHLPTITVHLQWPDSNTLIHAPENARAYTVEHDAPDDTEQIQPKLIQAVEVLARCAQDPAVDTGRSEAAHYAVVRFERAALTVGACNPAQGDARVS